MKAMSLGRRVLWSVSVAGVLAIAAVRGAAVQQSQSPVFRSETELVAIDVNVLSRDGRPLTTLKPEEFQVTIDGRARRVVQAQYIAQRQAGPSAPVNLSKVESDEALDVTYASNETAASASPAVPAGRSVIVAIDQSSFSATAARGVVTAATGLLAALNPLDRVGLIAFPSPGPAVAPTVNHERVRAALGQVAGTSEPPPRPQTGLSLSEALGVSRGDPGELERVLDRVCAGTSSLAGAGGQPSQAEACRSAVQADVPLYVDYARRGSAISLQEIRNTMRLLAAVPGPKTVVLISAGLIAGEHASALGTLNEVKAIAEMSALAQTTLYVIFVESSFFDANSLERQRMSGFAIGESDVRQAGLQHLAALTGGPVFRLGAGSSTAFARVAQELSGYYLLGVESQPGDRDGQVHPIKVRVTRAGVTVRAREQVFVPQARSARTGDEAILAALKNPGIERDLPIRLSTQVLRDDTPGRIRLVLSAAIGRGVQGASSVRVAYSIRSSAGNAAESGVESRRLPVVGTGEDASLTYVDTVLLTPARYTVRLAAADAAGRLGTIEHDVTAGLVTGSGAMLSDLILVDPSRVPESGLSPLSDGRVWSDRLDAYIEVYPEGAQRFSSATFEVADRPGAAALVSYAATVKEVDAGRRWTAQGGVDLTPLPPGAYTLVARVFDGPRLVGVVGRPFRFEGVLTSLARGGPRLPFSMSTAGSIVRGFRREDALRPEALGFFVGRLQAADTAAASPALNQASEAAKAGQFDAVLEHLGGAVEPQLSPSFLRGLALFARGDLEPAAAQFRAALRASNDFLPAAFYLGACYAAGGRDREAVGAWQTSLITESESRIVYDVLADGWLRLNDGRQAESILREAIGRWPGDDSFVPRLAAALAIRQERAEALATLAPYLVRRPDDAEALFLAVRLLYDAKAAGEPVKSAAEDAALAVKYAVLYRDAGGASYALVDRWAAFVGRGAGR